MSETLPAERATFSLVPSSYDDAVKISKTLAASDLVPKDYKGKAENCFVAIAWGQELGLPPLQALQNIAVINGRPAIWGDAALAIVMAHPAFEDIHEEITGEGENRVAVCTIKRKGRSPVVREFSVADAKKASLWGKQGPWQQYPDRMQQLRARGFALRDAFPDAMRGFKIAEEAQDIEPEKDNTPRPAVVMPQSTKAAPVTQPTSEPEPTFNTETGEIYGYQPEPMVHPEEQAERQVQGEPTATEGQLKVMRSKLTSAGLTEQQMAHAFGVPTISAIPASRVNDALAWIKNGGGERQ